MSSTDLLFGQSPNAPGGPVEIVFGDDDDDTGGAVELRASGRITGLRGHVVLRKAVQVRAAGTITGMRGHIGARYDINVDRSMVRALQQGWQQARPLSAAIQGRYEQGTPVRGLHRSVWQDASPLQHVLLSSWQDAQRLARLTRQAWQEAQPRAPAPVLQAWQEASRLRASTLQRFEQGQRISAGTLQRFEEATRLRRATVQRFEQGQVLGASVITDMGTAVPMSVLWVSRFEEARRPPPGITTITLPQPDPCYIPELPAHLVFDDPADSSLPVRLVFVCKRHGQGPEPGTPLYVIPLLEIYMSVHSIDAVMLPSLEPVALSSTSITSNDGEYGWSLSASGKAPLFDQLAPVGGFPARVRVTIDGTSWVFAIDPPSRTRRWGDHAVQITGRSMTSLLAEPHMPVQSWTNPSARTAQQLVLDALQYTGVGLDWGIPDWLVPAGAWNHQGSPLNVAVRIAEAVGAIVQSHRSEERLQFLPRYPLMPWEWATATPDVQMPLAQVESDTLQPMVYPAYNGVYVAGVNYGPLGFVRRAGTAGDVLAPMVTDALITHVDAARQRGRAVLGAGGTLVMQPLELPVLTGPGLPGVLQKNQLVEMVEPGITWRGLVRSITLTTGMPTVRQNVVLERHL